MPDSLDLVWGPSVHFATFPIPRFSKHYVFNSFNQISTKLQTKYHNWGLIYQGRITFFGGLPKTTNSMPRWNFPNTESGLEISKCYFYGFHLMSAKLYEEIGLPWWNTAITFRVYRPVLKILWQFEILIYESMGKPKIWNISKTAEFTERNGQKFGTPGSTVHII